MNGGRDAPDLLVVGGGPAGSTTALLLARAGRRVVLLERRRFPRAKPCGECLNPGGVEALRRLGLLEAVEALRPAPLEGWRIREPDGPAAVGSFGTAGRGLGVPRSALDDALLREAERAGVEVHERVQVLEAVEAGREGPLPAVRTIEADGRRGERRARLVVGADGLRSTCARALGGSDGGSGLRKLSLTCRIRGSGPPRDRGLLVVGGWTVGLAPVSAERPLWNATVVVDPEVHGRAVADDARGFFLELLRASGVVWAEGPDVVAGPWGSGPFDRPRSRVTGEGLLLVGDAAGYYDPLTGQGMYRALRSAELAAAVASEALEAADPGRAAPGRLLAPYGRRLVRERRPGYRVQRTVEAVLSRDRTRRWALRRLARPGALDPVVRVTGDAAPVRSLLRPRAWLPLVSPGGRAR